MTIVRTSITAHVHGAGYRMGADAWAELDKAVLTLLDRAMRYTRPAKTIRATEIILALGKNGNNHAKEDAP